jgi:hypothetical protein
VWKGILKTQSKRAEDYEWYTNDQYPLKKPWYDQEIVVFRDPNRSSTVPVNSWEEQNDSSKPGPNFGPSAGGSGSAAQPPASGYSSSVPPAAGSEGEGHNAPSYTRSTRRPQGSVDVRKFPKCPLAFKSISCKVKIRIRESHAPREPTSSLFRVG